MGAGVSCRDGGGQSRGGRREQKIEFSEGCIAQGQLYSGLDCSVCIVVISVFVLVLVFLFVFGVFVVLVVVVREALVIILRLRVISSGAFRGYRRSQARHKVGLRRGSGLGRGANRIVPAGKQVGEKGVEGFQSEKHGFVSLCL